MATITYSFLFFLFLFSSSSSYVIDQDSNKLNTSSSSSIHLHNIRSICKSTPFPQTCFDSLKLSVSINISPNILNYLLKSLEIALSESTHLSNLLSTASNSNNAIVETQRGTLQDCVELHEVTQSSLRKSASLINSQKRLFDAKAFLSAALTNKITCFEGLDSASGPFKQTLSDSFVNTYKHISNSLSLLSKSVPQSSEKIARKPNGRRLLSQRILESDDDEDSGILTVSSDGTGNFTTITDAINFAPNNSLNRVIIYIKQGVYEESVNIPIYKTNIVLLGDGKSATIITGSRSMGDGWTTFRSATVAVSGEGFLARDLTIENTAGPEKHQAVALRINADLAAVYRCSITGYQDTLYTHSFRQFYRECDILGTIDYIFGNAAAVFQGCSIISRLPMPGQFNVITAQSRDSGDEDTGFSVQNCSIIASDDLVDSNRSVKSYLGRPWRAYSRTVFIESYIDDLIDVQGWKEWSENNVDELATVYYGEYENDGPSSDVENRVGWDGFHVMDYNEATNYSVEDFIRGDDWLGSTSFPYDDGV